MTVAGPFELHVDHCTVIQADFQYFTEWIQDFTEWIQGLQYIHH